MLLAGDIGGTKTNLAVFSSEAGWRKPFAEATYSSINYPDLESLVREFLAQHDFIIDRASFGVAGPVVAGHASITNLPWMMDEQQLQQALQIPSVRLMNDLDAIAHSVPYLDSQDLYTLNKGQAIPGGAIAVIAPGTGLGEAFLTWNGSQYKAHTSEGGHADFAPANSFQVELLRYLMVRFPHVSFERVCSGKGIPNIYDYLKDSGHAEEPQSLAEELAGTQDRSPVIVNNALDKDNACELCIATLNAFVSILAAESSNLALKVLATGGVYIGGGIPPRILSYLQNIRFMQVFTHKGRLTPLLSQMPVHVILNPKVALLGAAIHGFEKHGEV
ncbi:MAG TPA: glucokinase [Ktedonobacteraceae bacterium]|nr:glucokinase [Ktedonobacteraceae bacterium]